METLKTVLIAAIVACITAGILVAVLPKDSSGNPTAPTFGALAGPDIPSDYLKWGASNGVRLWPTGRPLATATTTVCAIQSPNATSTLRWAGVKLDVSSTTASTITLAKSATAFATTTQIGETVAVAANAQAFVLATTTTAQVIAQTTVFAPSQWLVVSMTGGAGTFSPSGACQATFEEYPTF